MLTTILCQPFVLRGLEVRAYCIGACRQSVVHATSNRECLDLIMFLNKIIECRCLQSALSFLQFERLLAVPELEEGHSARINPSHSWS